MKKTFLSLLLVFSAFFAHAQGDILKQVAKQTAIQAALSYAQSKPELSKFATLLQTAQTFGLLGKSASNPLTFLAPNNSAFDAMPKGGFEKLLTNKKSLTSLLNNHVISGANTAENLGSGLKNMSGKALNFAQEGEKVTVNGANILESNLPASDGSMLHIIDKILN